MSPYPVRQRLAGSGRELGRRDVVIFVAHRPRPAVQGVLEAHRIRFHGLLRQARGQSQDGTFFPLFTMSRISIVVRNAILVHRDGVTGSGEST